MINNMSLIKDEAVIKKSSFRHSAIMFFLKSEFVITNKRLLGKISNTFWIIPVGTDKVTCPLYNLAGARLEKKLHIKFFLFSLVILLIGLVSLNYSSYVGIILILMGKIGIISSRQKLIVVQDNNGLSVSCSISRTGVTKANQLINVINSRVAKRA